MENICCIVCGKNNSSPFITLQDRLTHTLESFNLVKCECNFVYLNPRPDKKEAQFYYQSPGYDPHDTINKDIWSKMYHLVQKFTLRWKYRKITSS